MQSMFDLSHEFSQNSLQLEQQKLDVAFKNRSNLFSWRGQFTPEFIEYMLNSFAQKNYHIFDPFSGSGTVLHESARLGLKATGFEINPSAYAMSKFFSFCNLSHNARTDFCRAFEQKLYKLSTSCLANIKTQTNGLFPDYPDRLTFVKQFSEQLHREEEQIFFMNILFLSEKDSKPTVTESIYSAFNYLKKQLLNLPYTNSFIETHLLDARSVGNGTENSVDLVITSPPYINVFNYHQNYRAIMESLNFNVLKVAHSEFGSNRKNRGNRFKTVIQYCLDIELAVKAFWRALKPQAKMVLVVGRESNVRGVPFYNGQLVTEIIENSAGFSGIRTLERQFTNKFGINIKEDIIIATKADECSDSSFGRLIAVSHLQKSLEQAAFEVRRDITEAIEYNERIDTSPLFDPQHIMKK